MRQVAAYGYRHAPWPLPHPVLRSTDARGCFILQRDMEDEKKSPAAGITAAKAIGDLDAIVQAIMKALPPAKPWQRQLLQHLAEIERTTQVLRMTILLERDSSEVMDAKDQLRVALRVANRYVAMGRADFGTKAAVRLAFEIGQRIDETVT